MNYTSHYDISYGGDGRDSGLSVSMLEYYRGGSCAVVSLSGRAGIGDCGWVRLLLELQAAHERGHLVVDLSRLSSMDWWVAIILLWAGRVVTRRGGALVLVSPQPEVARLLNVAGASKVVRVYDSIQQACGSLPACSHSSA